MTAPRRSSDQLDAQQRAGETADVLRRRLLERRPLTRREAAEARALLAQRAVTVTRVDVPAMLTDRHGRPVDIRAAAQADGSGMFDGYALLWDVVDAYGTSFAPGTMSAGGLDGDPYALLWMHEPEAVVGQFVATEDDRGLWIAGGWDPTDEGQRARARAATGSGPGLSVGFVPMMLDPDNDTRFTQARLVEVSQITARMAAVPGAGFSSVRATLQRGMPGRDLEDESPSTSADVARAVLALTGARPRS